MYLKDLGTQKQNRKIPKQITRYLGASISILPGSLYDQYEFGPLRATATTVVLAGQTLKLPRGMLHDVIVKVEYFYFLVDFLVLNYVLGERTKQPMVILGRPFLATANAKIHCRTGTVDLVFGNHKLRLNVFTHVNTAPVDDECFMADNIDECIPLYDSVVDTDGTTETSGRGGKKLEVATLRGDRLPWSVQMEPLPEKIDNELKPSLHEAPKVKLKELPRHLKYALLGKNDTLPVIIASNLSLEQETALLKVLVANKEAIRWTIADLKWISPWIVMHKILTDPDVKPAHDAQRRLNPNMREVVKKEVLKWLDAGIIFAISDSTWEFDLEIRNKKGTENVVADHLSRIVLEDGDWDGPINESFPNELILAVSQNPWFAHIVNFKVAEDVRSMLEHAHSSACGAHFSGQKTARKVLTRGFYWLTLFRDAHELTTRCLKCQQLGSISKKDEIPLKPILVIDISDVWGIDFVGPFPNSYGNLYILVAVDYVSK
ncbi:uncharacterized protein LOC143619027 [Bidens hawaiensis]|uniref:uncharacterized protein LOC143619027 n=1 Tax=Bidens hawaiensis TaxID=980011 RepID=UPI00404A9ABE